MWPLLILAALAASRKTRASFSCQRGACMGQNEVGASICRTPTGGIVFGPQAEGTPMSVDVPIQCPAGSKFEGIFHTHPGGVPIPSPQDLRSGRSVNANILCIRVPDTGQTRCYRRQK